MTDWLKIAAETFEDSISYFDANHRSKIEDNIRMFRGEHPQGSKYTKDSYKNRSRLFRPKSRSVTRKNEAMAATAYFSNMDLIDITAQNPDIPEQAASASIMKEIMQYRLSKTIPWFKLVMGAIQEAHYAGIVISYQSWKYNATKKTYKEISINEFGEEVENEIEEEEIIQDEPCIELVPMENFRFDPAASWLDPIGTSPYLIHQIPMYFQDVKAMMKQTDTKTGMPKFKQMEDGEIRVAMNSLADSTRSQREGNHEDSKQSNKPIREFEIIWVHRNIVKMDGKDWVYYTLGTTALLTDPVEIKEAYFHGERPYVIGQCTIEAHNPIPQSIIGIGADLQREANEIVNQRLDNVKFVLNKRWIAKRGANVDVQSLLRNVPGSVTMANDVNGDVREVNFPDVTGSSYAEQDRVNVDYDDLVGNFSSGSVQTNRGLNETVGGLNLISAGANQMSGYLLLTFNETWCEPVLRQLLKLERAYETDEVIIGIAAEKAQLFQKYGIDEITDALIDQELDLTVNVGMGATDPNMKLQKFTLGMSSLSQISATAPQNVNMEEVTKEIFSHLGYKDGKRFFKEEDPKLQQMQQMIQQLQAQLESKQMEIEATLKGKLLESESEAMMHDADLEFKYDELETKTALERVKIGQN
jgi:hypothetical protein